VNGAGTTPEVSAGEPKTAGSEKLSVAVGPVGVAVGVTVAVAVGVALTALVGVGVAVGGSVGGTSGVGDRPRRPGCRTGPESSTRCWRPSPAAR
jgi:hypothetical protein